MNEHDLLAYGGGESVEDHILAAEVDRVEGNSIWLTIWTTTANADSASPRTLRVDLDKM